MPLYGQWSGSPRRFNALSCFNVRLDSPAPGAIYMPIMLLRRVAFPDFDRLSTKAEVEDGKSVPCSAQPNCAS
jgi:hypothetical protein